MGKKDNPPVTVEIHSEDVLNDIPAFFRVLCGKTVVSVFHAKVEHRPGADGRSYPAIVFKMGEPPVPQNELKKERPTLKIVK